MTDKQTQAITRAVVDIVGILAIAGVIALCIIYGECS